MAVILDEVAPLWSSPHPFFLGPPATDTLTCFLLFLTHTKVYELFPLPGTASSNFCPHPTLLILEALAYTPERTDPTDLSAEVISLVSHYQAFSFSSLQLSKSIIMNLFSCLVSPNLN